MIVAVLITRDGCVRFIEYDLAPPPEVIALRVGAIAGFVGIDPIPGGGITRERLYSYHSTTESGVRRYIEVLE